MVAVAYNIPERNTVARVRQYPENANPFSQPPQVGHCVSRNRNCTRVVEPAWGYSVSMDTTNLKDNTGQNHSRQALDRVPGKHQERRQQAERRVYTLTSMYRCLVSPRRTCGRRASDRRFAVLDTFDAGVVTLVILLTVFSILDAAFTLTLIARGGEELNPVMNYFLTLGTLPFMLAKMLLTTIPGLVLVASSNVAVFSRLRCRSLLAAMVGMYAGLMLYEILLLVASA